MRRNLKVLTQKEYDLVVIGGGIYGACAAWDASLRGLKVALLEKKDFGGATSSNSTKIAHGGLRYLQHLDFKRMRESIRERTALMRMAPHLVMHQPYLMPTYGHGIKGREVMAAAILANDLISIDRTWESDPAKRIPWGRSLSRHECLKMAPGIKKEGLSGGAIWYDGQMHNSERLTLAFVVAAHKAGADVANYTEVTGFLRRGDRLEGIKVRDSLSEDPFEVKSKMILNTAGPWAESLMDEFLGRREKKRYPLSKVFSFVTRAMTHDFSLALAIEPMYQDPDAIVKKGANMIFTIPWRRYAMLGSLHLPYEGKPEEFKIEESEIENFIQATNKAYPPAQLKREDIRFMFAGIIPAKAHQSAVPLKHYEIVDHSKLDRVDGIISIVSVKYTTVRDVTEKAINLVFQKLGKKPPKCRTAHSRVDGGDIEFFDQFMAEAIRSKSAEVSEETMRHLVLNYGSNYKKILAHTDKDPKWRKTLSNSSEILQAEVLHAVREEMALKLTDAILRRTELGTAGDPGEEALQNCVAAMRNELGWNDERIQKERDEVRECYRTMNGAIR